MDKRALTVLLFIFGGLFLVFFAFLVLGLTAVRGPDARPSRAPQIGVVEVDDIIMDSRSTLEALEHFRKDSRVRGIIVRIDSPGGAVAPTQEIYDAIVRTRDDKPVLSSLGNIAASGGYYVAAATEEIIANPGTLTGSIGVITQFTNLEGLAEWARIDVETIKVGELKDVGSPFRQMTDDEREYFLSLLEDIQEQFVGAVAKGRGVEIDEILPVADGRILTGRQAAGAGLVDHLGSIDLAVERLMEKLELPERPALVYPERDELQMIRELFGTASRSLVSGARDELQDTMLGATGPSPWLLPSSP